MYSHANPIKTYSPWQITVFIGRCNKYPRTLRLTPADKTRNWLANFGFSK